MVKVAAHFVCEEWCRVGQGSRQRIPLCALLISLFIEFLFFRGQLLLFVEWILHASFKETVERREKEGVLEMIMMLKHEGMLSRDDYNRLLHSTQHGLSSGLSSQHWQRAIRTQTAALLELAFISRKCLPIAGRFHHWPSPIAKRFLIPTGTQRRLEEAKWEEDDVRRREEERGKEEENLVEEAKRRMKDTKEAEERRRKKYELRRDREQKNKRRLPWTLPSIAPHTIERTQLDGARTKMVRTALPS
ncbi:hypothetical protein BLNAU_18506 [Blattamonas nauphoetae]|uniref:Uncharacterized protein n=1 Tax=Blattamonas nauphoetae TaxID=2049346 RepID=A0ABQ9X4T4_9EUKA|nr:hypothetical protein BLNAU_18506 [Blattamonas nauphoetae]